MNDAEYRLLLQENMRLHSEVERLKQELEQLRRKHERGIYWMDNCAATVPPKFKIDYPS